MQHGGEYTHFNELHWGLTVLRQVPALFVENFDYENMRPDFINGVLTSDLLGKTFSCSVVGEKNGVQAITSRSQPWAAHVGHLSSYAHVRCALNWRAVC